MNSWTLNSAIAENARNRRWSLGWDRRTLAQDSGCSLETIMKVEAGQGAVTLETRQRITASLGCTWLTLEEPGYFGYVPAYRMPRAARDRGIIVPMPISSRKRSLRATIRAAVDRISLFARRAALHFNQE
jgi:transcriptional regulator with XRE-family HTH domain